MSDRHEPHQNNMTTSDRIRRLQRRVRLMRVTLIVQVTLVVLLLGAFVWQFIDNSPALEVVTILLSALLLPGNLIALVVTIRSDRDANERTD